VVKLIQKEVNYLEFLSLGVMKTFFKDKLGTLRNMATD
jgi:hypothetical protein